MKAQFDTYVKYISREFKDKTEAFADKEVVSSKCYLCHRNLRKKIKWFSANGRHYYCVAYCEKHGYLKGKIRVRKAYDGGVYIVKTTKLIPKEEAEAIAARRDHAREVRKRQSTARRGMPGNRDRICKLHFRRRMAAATRQDLRPAESVPLWKGTGTY